MKSLPNNSRSEAGFTLVEAIVATVIALLGLLLVTGFIGAEGARAVLHKRHSFGLEWSKTGMGEVAARARIPSAGDRTESASWSQPLNAEYRDMGSGTILKTGHTSSGANASPVQQLMKGPGYVEFTPAQEISGVGIYGPQGWRRIDTLGSAISILEDGNVVANNHPPTNIGDNQIGDRYRIEITDHVRYRRIRGQISTLIWESAGALPGYPVSFAAYIYNQNNSITNVQLSGNLSNPSALADGGTVTPGDTCAAPYCDAIYRAPRNGSNDPAPVAVPPGETPPANAELLFVRRVKVQTVDAVRGIRELNMTLASTTSARPFITRITRVDTASITP